MNITIDTIANDLECSKNEKKNLDKNSSSKNLGQNGKKSSTFPRVIVGVIVIALIALTIFLAVYFTREPKMINVSDPVYVRYSNQWQEVTRYFFDIYGLTLTDTVFKGSASASIVKTISSSIQQTSYEPFKSQQALDVKPIHEVRDYGFIDAFTSNGVCTIRSLNPLNRIYYFDLEAILQAYNQSQTQVSSRLLTDSHGRMLIEGIEDILAEVLAEKLAEIEDVEIDRIIVRKMEAWEGILNSNTKQYTIQTKTELPSQPTTTSNQTADEKKNLAVQVFDSILAPLIQEKKELIQDYGAMIADKFKFSFDQYIDLLVKFQKTTYFQTDLTDDDDPQDNSTIRSNPPVLITMETSSIYGNQPLRIKESKTMNWMTFQEITSCIDYNQTRKICCIDQWNREGVPFHISSQSRKNQNNFAVKTIYLVSVKPLPPDEVVQTPYYESEVANQLHNQMSIARIDETNYPQAPYSTSPP